MTPVALLPDADLFRRCRSGDRAAEREIISRYVPRARRVALKFRGRSEPMDDLEQVACVGLVKAVERFDPDQGSAFWTFALPTIIGELKRHFRDTCWVVHVPRSVQERVLAVSREMARLSGTLGRSPTLRELADAVGAEPEEVVEALDAGSAYDPRSLDAAVGGEDGDVRIGDLLGADDAGLEAAEGRAAIEPALQCLPARERLILHLRFSEDMTQSEIADVVGISQMHVSRLIRRSLATLRSAMGDQARVGAAA